MKEREGGRKEYFSGCTGASVVYTGGWFLYPKHSLSEMACDYLSKGCGYSGQEPLGKLSYQSVHTHLEVQETVSKQRLSVQAHCVNIQSLSILYELMKSEHHLYMHNQFT